MRITWLISGQVTGHSPATWDCPLASVRYRVLQPSRYLVSEGHSCHWLRLDQINPEQLNEEQANLLCADVVVISKVLASGSLAIAQRARELGARVVVDLCDDHFDTPALSRSYFQRCETADQITASTPMMAQVIQQRAGRTACVIADPFEGPLGDAHFCPGVLTPALRLAWFGHPVNFDTVLAMLPGLVELSHDHPLDLHLVTDLAAAKQSPLLNQLAQVNSPRLTIRLSPWSLDATWQALAQCDAVVIPSLPEAKKQVKSPNRVIEGLRAGRFVVAYPLHSYQPLEAGCWLGTELAQGLRWALANPTAALQKITTGQLLIGQQFSPRFVGQQWEQLLQAVAECELLAFGG